ELRAVRSRIIAAAIDSVVFFIRRGEVTHLLTVVAMVIDVFAISRFSPGSACVVLSLWEQKNEAEQSNRQPDCNRRPYQDNQSRIST
ncbi:hypothetical protein, partial [Rhizobium tibeticum]|uniref:hypothetical protein n=1 Tax=Rhizobium tibeticum TaxID=501024 RepID=UPI001ABF9396